MDLDRVVPWGRDLDEYRRMFALPETDLDGRLLGCGDGPASFNAQATAAGHEVVSIDPLYGVDRSTLARRIDAARDEIMPQIRARPDVFVWSTIPSPDELEVRRMRAMYRFLDDVEAGLESGRYVEGGLPSLPFGDATFDLALCSHLLFLYSLQLDEAFRVAAVLEMCRVAREVRIHPLLGMNDHRRSIHLPAVLRALDARGHKHEEVPVDYEFQRGAVTMLRASAARTADAI